MQEETEQQVEPVKPKKRQLSETQALDSLKRKGVYCNGQILDLSNAKRLGNGSWGRIDFLSKYKGYIVNNMDEYQDRMKKGLTS